MTAWGGILKYCGSKKKRNAFVLLSDEPAQFCPTDVSQCRATVPPAPRLYCLECYWSEICRFSSSTCKQSLWLTEGLFGFGSTSGWAEDKSVESRCKMTKNISHPNIPAPLWIIEVWKRTLQSWKLCTPTITQTYMHKSTCTLNTHPPDLIIHFIISCVKETIETICADVIKLIIDYLWSNVIASLSFTALHFYHSVYLGLLL